MIRILLCGVLLLGAGMVFGAGLGWAEETFAITTTTSQSTALVQHATDRGIPVGKLVQDLCEAPIARLVKSQEKRPADLLLEQFEQLNSQDRSTVNQLLGRP